MVSTAGPVRLAPTMEIRDVMTESVVTAEPSTSVRGIAELMRARKVGSVVLVEGDRPVGFITDRDLAVSVLADGCDPASAAVEYASSPVVVADPGLSLAGAAALMVKHGIRRLAVMDGERLAGIVTLDDLAVRAGSPGLAQSIMSDITRAALPDFYEHLRRR